MLVPFDYFCAIFSVQSKRLNVESKETKVSVRFTEVYVTESCSRTVARSKLATNETLEITNVFLLVGGIQCTKVIYLVPS